MPKKSKLGEPKSRLTPSAYRQGKGLSRRKRVIRVMNRMPPEEVETALPEEAKAMIEEVKEKGGEHNEI